MLVGLLRGHLEALRILQECSTLYFLISLAETEHKTGLNV